MNEQSISKQKNSLISILLILLNTILAIIFFGLNIDDPDQIGALCIATISLTILQGMYALAYRGKQYRIAKWIFFIFLFISLSLLGLLWYAFQLGKAFQH